MIRFARAALLGLACCLASLSPSTASDYPNRPVRWLIGFAAGGPVDIVARIMSQWLSDRLGQQFVVENRAGGAGTIGSTAVTKAALGGVDSFESELLEGMNQSLARIKAAAEGRPGAVDPATDTRVPAKN